jgi:hypothetical protein
MKKMMWAVLFTLSMLLSLSAGFRFSALFQSNTNRMGTHSFKKKLDMGLDMHLFASLKKSKKLPTLETPNKGIAQNLSDEKISDDEPVELAYWRKVNWLHNWFVQKCQDGVDESCRETPVSKAQLEELLQTIDRVIQNPELAKELLPPRAGFFFGNTNIDEYYMENLKTTKEQVKKVLNEWELKGYENVHYYSWW